MSPLRHLPPCRARFATCPMPGSLRHSPLLPGSLRHSPLPLLAGGGWEGVALGDPPQPLPNSPLQAGEGAGAKARTRRDACPFPPPGPLRKLTPTAGLAPPLASTAGFASPLAPPPACREAGRGSLLAARRNPSQPSPASRGGRQSKARTRRDACPFPPPGPLRHLPLLPGSLRHSPLPLLAGGGWEGVALRDHRRNPPLQAGEGAGARHALIPRRLPSAAGLASPLAPPPACRGRLGGGRSWQPSPQPPPRPSPAGRAGGRRAAALPGPSRPTGRAPERGIP